jgi:hypothetical protein
VKSENFSKAKSVLEPALSDCDPIVRQRALVALGAISAEEEPSAWPSKMWLFMRAKLWEPFEIVVKTALGLLLAALLVWVLSLLARYPNRRKIVVHPLAVSGGGGFDGQHFVAIAAAMHHKMRALQRGAALPALSQAAPRMVMDRLTSATAEAVMAVAPDQAGKLASTLLRIFELPRYSCYGSAHFGGRAVVIVVRLERSGQIIAVWERSSSPGRLVEDLKDLSFLALQGAMAEIRSGRA